MTGSGTFNSRLAFVKAVLAMIVAGLAFAVLPSAPAFAQSGDRTLYIHYTHTGETARITFRRNGRYDQAGLNQLNQFLRDWRRNEPTRMDPALFDLIWTVYQEVGATEPIHVVSAYRAPETNEMLRARSSGVAENSRHTMGMAMDFYIPGVRLSKLREVAMRHQVGGVGYYPTSGSPFVHLDTGNVRAWPRMTRAQLQNLFPDGRTLHLPSEGNTPLSEEGRRYAMAQWQQCKSVPCAAGGIANTQITSGGGGNGRNLLDMLLGTGGDEVDTVQVASNSPRQQPTPAAVAPLVAPTPAPRSPFLDYRNPAVVPVPVEMPQAILVATHHIDAPDSQTAAGAATNLGAINPALDSFEVASIDLDNQPTPRALLTPETGDLPVLTAYAPEVTSEPDAQRALQMLIERRNAGGGNNVAAPLPELRGAVQTASLAPQPLVSLEDAANLFSNTWSAVQNIATGTAGSAVEQLALSEPEPDYELINAPERQVQFYSPDLANVHKVLVTSVSVSETQFGALFLPGEGDFSPATELGVHCKSMTFTLEPEQPATVDRFASQAPIFVASL